MKRLLVIAVVIGTLAGAAVFARKHLPGPAELQVKVEDHNPWNNLRLNNSPEDFHFAFVSDRTGGPRPGVFERALDQLNLLQPEFVVSVGDLIEGGTKDAARLNQQWEQADGFIARLTMPFFYAPGNHDIDGNLTETKWREKFGRRYYHFVYRNVLFLMLDTEDPPSPGGTPGHMGEEQVAFARRVLGENPGVRWTVVVLHRPIWKGMDIEKTGWLEVEEALKSRPYTVFAGHKHRYKKVVRNGRRYYTLATTGGASRLRGISFGEFDHVVWVTMKKDGPVMANLMMDGIFPDEPVEVMEKP